MYIKMDDPGLGVGIERIDKRLPLPEYETEGSSGCDLRSAKDTFTLFPQRTVLIPTGIKLRLPKNVEAQIRPRSGLAAKHGVTVLNSPGTVDSDYRGEVCVLLYNGSLIPYTIEYGSRIAQMVFMCVPKIKMTEIADVNVGDTTGRGDQGFGSTGGY